MQQKDDPPPNQQQEVPPPTDFSQQVNEENQTKIKQRRCPMNKISMLRR